MDTALRWALTTPRALHPAPQLSEVGWPAQPQQMPSTEPESRAHASTSLPASGGVYLPGLAVIRTNHHLPEN